MPSRWGRWSDERYAEEQERHWQEVLKKHGPLGCALRMLGTFGCSLMGAFLLITFIAALVRGCGS